ncbi:hypothetical protein PV08_05865 [Exophiala spinifera]|uniref:RRM domain-containing protein n=1 Tax=Exophiala spinifera TaxID=91928 RepID=A0A0D2BB24_9EURO|nr:uncharacterized protein PV08_05865 [Exophiala spinifera]KIW15815.1 hypothetical protein PV08_05865 [Exophiala spinifera]
MSYPPPPGSGYKPSTPASLPPRPPPPTANPALAFKPASIASSKPAFAGFAPRSVASNNFRTSSPAQYTASPAASYPAAPQYPGQPQYDSPYSGPPQIRNPFVPPSDTSSAASGFPPGYDPEYEAQIQQWQSAYLNKDGPTPSTSLPKPAGTQSLPTKTDTIKQDDTPKTVQRAGGGSTWTDPTLLEWDPAHFRIFVGNLAGEVTDESLLKAFSQYPSVQKARVIRDKRTTKSKGYGFVSFSDGDDYFRAARDMNGKYVGSHPIVVKKAVTDVRPTTQKQNKGKGGAGGHGKVQHGGVNKKQPKTKGGLKVLG